MRKHALALVAIVSVLATAIPLTAHHSVSAFLYDTRAVTISGTIAGIEWRNPHARITLSVRNADGSVTARRVEIAGPSRLMKLGLQREAVKVGDAVSIEVWMPRDTRVQGPDPSGRMLILADGRRFNVGDNWGSDLRMEATNPTNASPK